MMHAHDLSCFGVLAHLPHLFGRRVAVHPRVVRADVDDREIDLERSPVFVVGRVAGDEQF